MTSGTLLVSVPVVAPLTAAGLALLLTPWPRGQRTLSAAVLVVLLVDAAVLLARVDAQGPQALQAGGWAPPVGITLIADRLSALALLTAVVVCGLVFVYALGQSAAERQVSGIPSVFHPGYLVLLAGISLVFLTGDLFTMFVGFEVMLMASYVLITLGATPERVRSGMTYMVSSLTASIFLVTSIALVYAVTGTVNFAQLAEATADVPAGMRQLLGLLLLISLGIKAAMVPLHWWLPDSYPSAPAPVTAVFAALLTKVGVYAVIRTQTMLFPREAPWGLLLVIAAITMAVGVFGALVQKDLNRVLCFALVSHIGFMLFGLGISTVAGLTGAIIYLVHHITVQAALFLASGLVERERGTVVLSRLGGLAVTAPALAAAFLLPALSLGGVPPLAGFVAKVSLLQAAVEVSSPVVLGAAAVLLLASLLTLAAMVRVWVIAFWGAPAPRVADERPGDAVDVGLGSVPWLMRGAAAGAVLLGVGVAAAAGPLSEVAQRAAQDVVDGTGYRSAVLGPEAIR